MSMDTLPPLPGSDAQTLRSDRTDHFYKKRPSDIWMGHVESFEDPKPEKCAHRFIKINDGVQCSICNMILFGDLTVKDERVYFRDQKLM